MQFAVVQSLLLDRNVFITLSLDLVLVIADALHGLIVLLLCLLLSHTLLLQYDLRLLIEQIIDIARLLYRVLRLIILHLKLSLQSQHVFLLLRKNAIVAGLCLCHSQASL